MVLHGELEMKRFKLSWCIFCGLFDNCFYIPHSWWTCVMNGLLMYVVQNVDTLRFLKKNQPRISESPDSLTVATFHLCC